MEQQRNELWDHIQTLAKKYDGTLPVSERLKLRDFINKDIEQEKAALQKQLDELNAALGNTAPVKRAGRPPTVATGSIAPKDSEAGGITKVRAGSITHQDVLDALKAAPMKQGELQKELKTNTITLRSRLEDLEGQKKVKRKKDGRAIVWSAV